MSVPELSPSSAVDVSSLRTSNERSKLREVSEQFEALLLAEMLKSARGSDADGGWMGAGSDAGSATAMEYGIEMMAQAISASGGLGLSGLLEANLSPVSPASSARGPANRPQTR